MFNKWLLNNILNNKLLTKSKEGDVHGAVEGNKSQNPNKFGVGPI